MKRLGISVFPAGVLAVLLILTAEPPPSQNERHREESAAVPSYTLLFTGDIMLDRNVERKIIEEGNGDWRWPFLPVAEYLSGADFVFGNLESVISDKGRNVGSIYSFRAEPASVEGLAYAGFDVVSLANNHSFDYTALALTDSMARLKEADIGTAGAGATGEEAHSPALFELEDGTTVGVLAYTAVGSPGWQATETSPGIAWLDGTRLETLAADVALAKEQADILAVSFHFGEEYQPQPNETQRALAQAAIDGGAHLVVGHHPHVLQPLEQYGGGWIAYSLGNFVFDQAFSEETMRGAILQATVRNKTIQAVELLKTKQNSAFQAELAE